ncbi:flagellar basal body protein FliL [Actinokineospora sp.]|uniref:flagellar basal body protein FliL n=1 Tax=Actinokineospora sp. TaxID=1872133 RepID=UPI0040382AAB
MSWQEELRKLDEELATGRISADDYRVRRDQLLSSAAGTGGPAQAGPPSPAESTQFIAPTPAAPPPPNVERTQVVSDQADKTQIVPARPPEGTERTQIVGGNWQSTRPRNESDAERTQIVPGVPQQSGQYPPAPGYRQPPQSWNQPDENLAPPWAGSDFPPLAAGGSPEWIRQGPELFESGGSGKGSRIAVIAAVVVLVAGLGVGAFFFFNRDGSTDAQPPNTTAPTSTSVAPTTTVRPKDDLEVAELPGKREPTDHILTFADAEQSGFLTPDEIAFYKTAESGKCRLIVSRLPGDVNAYIFTTKAATPEAAVIAVQGLAQLQLKFGMAARPTAPTGVTTAEVDKAEGRPATLRAHYLHKGTIVRIQIYGDDLAKVQEAFDKVIEEQLTALPVDA